MERGCETRTDTDRHTPTHPDTPRDVFVRVGRCLSVSARVCTFAAHITGFAARVHTFAARITGFADHVRTFAAPFSSSSRAQAANARGMSKVIGILPARWGSTRFPGKPLHPIAGKPLIWHAWKQACKAKTLDEVIVATDDMRIAEAAFDFGAAVSVTSPKHPSGTDRIAEVASRESGATIIVNIQGDEPRMAPRTIDRLVMLLKEAPRCGMATAANPIASDEDFQNPNIVKVVLDDDQCALYFSRAPIPHRREPTERRPAPRLQHQGIYAFRRRTLLDFVQWKPTALERTERLEQLRALEHGVKIKVLITKTVTHGVDTPDDARKIERELL